MREPVAVTRHGGEGCVLISSAEHHRLPRRGCRVFGAEDLTDEEIALIEKAEVPPGYERLDDELKGEALL